MFNEIGFGEFSGGLLREITSHPWQKNGYSIRHNADDVNLKLLLKTTFVSMIVEI